MRPEEEECLCVMGMSSRAGLRSIFFKTLRDQIQDSNRLPLACILASSLAVFVSLGILPPLCFSSSSVK